MNANIEMITGSGGRLSNMPLKKEEKRKLKRLYIKKKNNLKSIKEMWNDLTFEEKKDLVRFYEKEIKEWDL